VQEETAAALGLVVLPVAHLVLADVDLDEPGLSVLDPDVALAEVARPARSALTSVPVSWMPASRNSRRWYSWLALRLRARTGSPGRRFGDMVEAIC